MKVVSVEEANSSLPALLSEVELGAEVVIAREGHPVAKLTRIEPSRRRREMGAWRTLPGWQDFRYDRAAFAPLTDEEMAAEQWP